MRGSHLVEQDRGAWDSHSGKFALQAVAPSEIERLLQENEVVDALVPAGTAVLFSGLAAHGLATNRSASPRCNAYLAFAAADNRPAEDRPRRPRVSPYQLNVDPVELEAVDDGALARLAAAQAASFVPA